MRQLGSKLLAGGLSAGAILLWWPMFFRTDSVTAWLVRGIAWTLMFELLLLALSPFEVALWSTARGERLIERVQAGRALLEHDSPRRRIGRRAVLALGALAVPLALIALGVSSHIPSPRPAPVRVTRVTRVVRVVKPVRVQRVVQVESVAATVPAAVPRQPAKHVPRPSAARRSAGRTKKVIRKPPVANAAPMPKPTGTEGNGPVGSSTQSPATSTAPPAASQTS